MEIKHDLKEASVRGGSLTLWIPLLEIDFVKGVDSLKGMPPQSKLKSGTGITKRKASHQGL